LASLKRRHQSAADLKGKVALITGASQGIGLAIAVALFRAGCELIITGRSQTTLNKAAQDLGRRGSHALALACDVRSPAEVAALFKLIRKQFRRLDILINNAGVAHPSLGVAKLPLTSWQEVIDTNLTGMFLVTQKALPLMKRGGAIVNNLSIAAKRAFLGLAAYNASKHGALGFTNTLREELRPRGIRVIAVLPGATDTAIWHSMWPAAPRKKMMSAETVAEAVVNALLLPENCTQEEVVIMPAAGTL
jgi:NAD(P)-dependent dehydrogenase (short-subunit alcohol dehydrogenase family)